MGGRADLFVPTRPPVGAFRNCSLQAVDTKVTQNAPSTVTRAEFARPSVTSGTCYKYENAVTVLVLRGRSRKSARVKLADHCVFHVSIEFDPIVVDILAVPNDVVVLFAAKPLYYFQVVQSKC